MLNAFSELHMDHPTQAVLAVDLATAVGHEYVKSL